MKRDEITRLAWEVGIHMLSNDSEEPTKLERFASLIGEAETAKIKEELDYLRRAHAVTLRSAEELRLQRDDLFDEVMGLRKAVLAEREACAKVCDDNLYMDWKGNPMELGPTVHVNPEIRAIAAAIRARGETP